MKSITYTDYSSPRDFLESLNAQSHLPYKQSLYFDVDDCVLLSLEATTDIINHKYRPLQIPKSYSEVKDWDFKSIYRSLTKSQLDEIFASDEFWNHVGINPGFFSILNSPIPKKYNCFFITKGSPENLEKKKAFLEKAFGKLIKDFLYIGLPSGVSKGIVDMKNSIVVDDNCKYLMETNAKIKVLNMNLRETDYNNAFGNYNDVIDESVYYANDMSEVKDLLEFNLKERL